MSVFNERYHPDSSTFRENLHRWRKEFQDKGLLVLPEFLSQNQLSEAIQSASQWEDQAFFQEVTGNAYLAKPDKKLPASHPLNRFETTSLSVLAYDQIPHHYLIRQIYDNDLLLEVVRKIFDSSEMYRYACPMGAMNIAYMNNNDYLRWHFDQSEFVVSIPLQDAASGGIYQYVSNLKSYNNPNYDGVSDVLDGNASAVQTLEAPCGSLVFFRGMHTIHRVTKIQGKKTRIVALLGFSLTPSQRSDDFLLKMRYGRTT